MRIFLKEENNTHITYTIFGIKIKIKKVYENNKMYLIDKNGNKKLVKKVDGLKIVFKGSNNVVEIGCYPLPKFEKCTVVSGNNSYLRINSSKYVIKNFSVCMYDETSIIIGKNFSINSGYFTTDSCSGLSIKIGDDCMFGSGIYIRPTDGHTLYDVNTLQPVNKSSDIVIGNHVWLAKNVAVLKGSIIPDNTVVGFGGVYTQSTNKIASENVVFAGNPLRVIRNNVNWDR